MSTEEVKEKVGETEKRGRSGVERWVREMESRGKSSYSLGTFECASLEHKLNLVAIANGNVGQYCQFTSNAPTLHST